MQLIKDDQRKRSVWITTYQDEGIVIGISKFQNFEVTARFYGRKQSVAIRPITKASESRLLRLMSYHQPTECNYSPHMQGASVIYRFYRWFDQPACELTPFWRKRLENQCR